MTTRPGRKPRIDSHHHIWDLTVRDQEWIIGDEMAPIRRDFGVGELQLEIDRCGIDATVVVQTLASHDETTELLDLAGRTPFIAGVVGYVDLETDDVGDRLDRLLDAPGGQWLVGVRHVVEREPDPDWLCRPRVLSGLGEVARRNLAYDLLIGPHQFDAAHRAVAEVANGRFVLDHLGKPAIASGTWEPWATQLGALASLPNVSAKVSGLVTEANRSTWSPGDLKCYIDHALTTFGTNRLIFGSDWPVCLLAGSYTQAHQAAIAALSALSDDETAAIFGANAVTTYRLTVERRNPYDVSTNAAST